jgi:hypothetical protein
LVAAGLFHNNASPLVAQVLLLPLQNQQQVARNCRFARDICKVGLYYISNSALNGVE